MKRAFPILLAVLIILQMMVNVGIGVYYHLNKEYITKQLCINKSNPGLHCNGRCYLAKQLQKAEDHEKQSSQSFKERDEMFSGTVNDITISYFADFSITHYMPYTAAQPRSGNFNAVIKPPSA